MLVFPGGWVMRRRALKHEALRPLTRRLGEARRWRLAARHQRPVPRRSAGILDGFRGSVAERLGWAAAVAWGGLGRVAERHIRIGRGRPCQVLLVQVLEGFAVEAEFTAELACELLFHHRSPFE